MSEPHRVLEHIQQPQFRLDCNPLSTCQLRRDRDRRAEESLSFLDMAVGFDGDLGNPLEILGVWRNHDVHILRSSNDTPGVYRKAADENELGPRLGESVEELIEGWLGQLRRAAPVNRIS